MDRLAGVQSRPLLAHRRNKSSASVLKSIIKGKENTTPPSTATSNDQPPIDTPIWAQFASISPDPTSLPASPTRIPLNDRSQEPCSPSKKKSLQNITQAAKSKPIRPNSELVEKNKSSNNFFLDVIGRNSAKDVLSKSAESKSDEKKSKSKKVPLKAADESQQKSSNNLLTMAKKGTKVMGLVAAFNSKSTNGDKELSNEEIDEQFEAVLVSRNIPENMRQNLRSLKSTVKFNLIKGNEFDLSAFGAQSSSKSTPNSIKERSRTSTHRRGLSDADTNYEIETDKEKKSEKRGRSRSRNFTFSKSRSRSKKAKGDESHNLQKSPSMVSLVAGKRGSYTQTSKSSTPEDFVSYLRSQEQPAKVEVGKVHRLKQLLRNETVSWVETFIKLGGMNEIVELLHRIMKIEWREEHEDQLLHETLLCLKALCTTDTALTKLGEIEKTLFPSLLSMIFDPENKGPSEYTTRGIIMNILIAHLNAAKNDTESRTCRARDILQYLSDPVPPEEKRPVNFIMDMRQSRPYKVWHREVSNVTKEVFWIFLHHHNIIPLPTSDRPQSSSSRPSTSSSSSFPCSATMNPNALDMDAEHYHAAYKPRPRAPVPAAPYVGGVEWDATTYLAAHLDLLNGLLASLPARGERNALRAEMRASGWERVMGSSLRTCKEKFYDCVHAGLRDWVAAAAADGWDGREVRFGPRGAPAPAAKGAGRADKPPVLDTPKLDLDLSDEVKAWI